MRAARGFRQRKQLVVSLLEAGPLGTAARLLRLLHVSREADGVAREVLAYVPPRRALVGIGRATSGAQLAEGIVQVLTEALVRNEGNQDRPQAPRSSVNGSGCAA
jgi:hypothetical protein